MRVRLKLFSSLVLALLALAAVFSTAVSADASNPVLHGVEIAGKDVNLQYTQNVDAQQGTYNLDFFVGTGTNGVCDQLDLQSLGNTQLSTSANNQSISFVLPVSPEVPEGGYCFLVESSIPQAEEILSSNTIFVYPSIQEEEQPQVLGTTTTDSSQVLATQTLADTGTNNYLISLILGLALAAVPLVYSKRSKS